jgi:hypothetical protein
MLSVLHWPLLGLYVLGLCVGLLVTVELVLWGDPDRWWALGGLLGVAACQVLFFVGRGDTGSRQQVTHRQLIAPIVAAAVTTTILVITAGHALGKAYPFALPWHELSVALVLAVWGLCGLLLATGFVCDYVSAAKRILLVVAVISLLQLAVTCQANRNAPATGFISRTTGTEFDVVTGLAGLWWCLGCGTVLLLVHNSRSHKSKHCPRCNYALRGLQQPRCPECGRTFTPRELGVTLEELRSSGVQSGLNFCERCDYEHEADESMCLRCGLRLELPGKEAVAALEHAQNSLQSAHAVKGEEPLRSVDALANLAEAERRLGMLPEAGRHAQEAVTLARQFAGRQSPILPRVAVLLARILIHQCRAQAARDVARESVELLSETSDANAALRAEAESILGWSMVQCGQAAEAEPLLARSCKTLQTEAGIRDRRTLRALNAVIDAYLALDQWDTATKYHSMFAHLQ